MSWPERGLSVRKASLQICSVWCYSIDEPIKERSHTVHQTKPPKTEKGGDGGIHLGCSLLTPSAQNTPGDRCVQDTTHTPAFRGLTTGLATGHEITSVGSRWYGARQPSEGPETWVRSPWTRGTAEPSSSCINQAWEQRGTSNLGAKTLPSFHAQGPPVWSWDQYLLRKFSWTLRKHPKTRHWTPEHLCSTSLSLCLHLYHQWRRQWHPTPVLLPGKSHRRRSLVGCSPWGR